MRLKLGEQVPNLHARDAVHTTKKEPFDESFCKKYEGNRCKFRLQVYYVQKDLNTHNYLFINKMIRNTLHVQ